MMNGCSSDSQHPKTTRIESDHFEIMTTLAFKFQGTRELDKNRNRRCGRDNDTKCVKFDLIFWQGDARICIYFVLSD